MKKISLLVILCGFITTSGFAQSITDSLVFYYPFSNSFLDEGSNGFHPTNHGASFIPDRNSWENHAIHLDGIDDYVQLPYDVKMQPDLPISFSFWIKVENFNSVQNRYFVMDDDFSNYSGVRCHMSGSGHINVHFGANQNNTGYQYRRGKESSATVTIGNWHHIVLIVRSATDISIYIDCVDALGSYIGSGLPTMAYSGSPGKIGLDTGNANSGPLYNYGAFDDFAMWNREITYTEVMALCTGNPLGIENGEHLMETAKVKVYPNPAMDIVQIDLNTNSSDAKMFVLYDLQGRIILRHEIQSSSFSVQRMGRAPGLYFYKVVDKFNNNIASGKITFE